MKKCFILQNSKYEKIIKIFLYLISIIFWFFVWDVVAEKIDKEIFLPKPLEVFDVIFTKFIQSKEFYETVKCSVSRILEGFLIGTVAGVCLAILSYSFRIIKIYLWFPIKTIKTIPVASFVILVLLWVNSSKLSVVIPLLMVLPTMYINTLTGLESIDYKILEMAMVFKIPFLKKIWYIYIPDIMPYIFSSASIAIGMAWKSGVAAEIIGLAKNTIGNELYKAKLYLMTTELFAWTIVIVALCLICEVIIKFVARIVVGKKR